MFIKGTNAFLAGFSCLLLMPDSGMAESGNSAAWKNIPLSGDDILLSFDGSARERFEWADHRDLGLSGGRDSAFMTRFLLGTRLEASRWFSSYVQLGSSLASTRPEGNKLTDRNSAYLAQAYADFNWPDSGYGVAQFRIGRQEIPLGSLHIMGTRDGPNIRRAFDAVRSSWTVDDNRIDIFGGYPIALQEGSFRNHTDKTQKIWGIYGATTYDELATGVDLYYLGFESDDAKYVEGSGHERRYTAGLRLYGSHQGFDWDNEFAWQYGHFQNSDIRAWSASVHTGYTLNSLNWKPRAGIKAGIASGDRHPDDGQLNTFNALYPKLPFLTENGIVVPANLMDISPSLQFSPTDGLLLDVSWHNMWRHEKNDAFWIAPGRPVAGTDGGERYIGQQTQIEATWTPVKSLQFKFAWAYFDVSQHLKKAGIRDMNFVMTSATFSF